MIKIKIGVLTASDRASAGIYEDISGPAIIDTLNDYLKSEWEPVYKVIADDQAIVEETLIEMADSSDCCLIVTTGGIGPAPRDLVPEATENVCNKMMPGFGELMRQVSLQYVPTAILSRQTAGIRNNTLIINLPGSPKAAQENLEVILPVLEHAVQLLREDPQAESGHLIPIDSSDL